MPSSRRSDGGIVSCGGRVWPVPRRGKPAPTSSRRITMRLNRNLVFYWVLCYAPSGGTASSRAAYHSHPRKREWLIRSAVPPFPTRCSIVRGPISCIRERGGKENGKGCALASPYAQLRFYSFLTDPCQELAQPWPRLAAYLCLLTLLPTAHATTGTKTAPESRTV